MINRSLDVKKNCLSGSCEIKEIRNLCGYKRSIKAQKTTPRTDVLMKKVMNFPKYLAKKLRPIWDETGFSVSRRTVCCRLVREFVLKSQQLARESRLTQALKMDFQFALQHKDYTGAQWFRVLFLDEFCSPADCC